MVLAYSGTVGVLLQPRQMSDWRFALSYQYVGTAQGVFDLEDSGEVIGQSADYHDHRALLTVIWSPMHA